MDHLRSARMMDDKSVTSEGPLDSAGTLQAFAECADAVAATTKKLEKAGVGAVIDRPGNESLPDQGRNNGGDDQDPRAQRPGAEQLLIETTTPPPGSMERFR